ncbi:hypothetical protein M408DRAFT_333515 [Serendipita vermifera MAFF 305830]|uniref:Methyltransferase domain-containing protein n=1 Tax=Serendipita vermifera MAFF 305830 TaxID=933852 RepID=A0A0C3AQ45_SERVB|nr:hypothetical protein M408DRAFT_333515 [Serendipita vermifera MAFF 305830]
MDDSESSASVYTYNSARDASKFVKEVEGRTFNVLSDTYFLPTDDDEWTRLNKQHVAIKLGLSNRLYPAPEVVRAVLKPEPGVTKKILDLGSGTGAWAIEMAREFPEAEVIGVDLAPSPVDAESLPSNCRFEIDNVCLGLGHFRGEFDLVHARVISTGITDFRQSIVDVENCLRPGGMIIWIDIDFDMYSNNRFAYRHFATEENPTGSWFQRFTYEMRRQAVKRGSDLFTLAAELDAGFWSHELLDPETCKTASLYVPLGPWAQCRTHAQTQQLLYTGALMRQDSMSMHKAVHPMLVRAGWPAETVAEWGRLADLELGGSHEPLWARFMVAWGRKRQAPELPAPTLPELEPSQLADEESVVPYPAYYVYHTPEHAKRQADFRNSKKRIPPPPDPPGIPEAPRQ